MTPTNPPSMDRDAVLRVLDERIAELRKARDEQLAFVHEKTEWYEPPKGPGALDVLARREAALAVSVETRAAIADLYAQRDGLVVALKRLRTAASTFDHVPSVEGACRQADAALARSTP